MSWRIVVVGIGLYLFLVVLPTALMSIDTSILAFFKSNNGVILHEWLGHLAWLIPGYLAGFRVKARGLEHGAIIGAVGSLTSQVMWHLFYPLGSFSSLWVNSIHWSLSHALLCALAASLGELHAYKRSQL